MPKILIVDDEWLTRLEIEGMLTDLGYDVAGQAETGAEAIAMARELNPDLILMDVKMPGKMNGIDAAREIKAELKIPIVFISGYGDPEHIEAAKEIAVFGYVMKPFDEREVHAFVEIALSRRKLELELEKSHERLEQTNLDLRKEIAARKNTEMALRENRKLYWDIFEKNNAIKWLLDPSSGEIIDANSAACKFYQYSHEEITKLRLWDINTENEADVRKLLADASSDGNTELTFKHRLASGEIRDVQVYTGTLESGGKKLLHSIIIDITDRIRAEKALIQTQDDLERRVEIRTAELAEANKQLQEENEMRKRTEDALRESEEHLRSFMESAKGFVVYRIKIDPKDYYKAHVVFVSPNLKDVIGVSPREEFSEWFKNIHEDDLPSLINAQNESAQSGVPLDQKFRLKGPEGEWRWLHVISNPVFDLEGKPEYYNGITIDITEQKEAKRALYEKERFHEGLLNDMITFVAVLDPSGDIIFVNNTPLTVGGVKLEDIIGKKFFDAFWWIHSDEVREMIKRDIEQCASGESIIHDVPIQTADGSLMWIEFSMHPIHDEYGVVQYLIPEGRDITTNKEAEKALCESEEKFRLISEQSLLSIGIIQNGHIIYGNEMYSKLTGYSLEEIYGWEPYGYARTVYKDDLPLVMKQSRKKQTGDEDVITNYQFRGFTKSKEIVWWDLHSRTITYHGRPADLFTLIDITEKVESENDRMALQAKLQHAQKMEAIGTLAGGVAHDLNNVLGGLVSYPELLLLQLPEDSPLRKPILTIQKSGEKAAAVVQDLLTLARRGVVVTEVVKLNDVIVEYLKSLEFEKLQSYHPAVHLEAHLEKNVLNILGSSTHLSKTVMNLVSNAAEAMPEGGNLTVSTENRYMDRPIKGYDDVKEGDYVVLTVSDTGAGIASDDLDKIFEPFYTKKKMGRSGTGLGMAVVWGTVKDHNGYIDVQSTEGRGTTFTLYFPVTRKKLPEDESSLSVEAYSGNGECILIVDDVEEQRQIASGMLEELGYSVVSVSSGEEAVEYLRTNKIDLLVLDMIMDPGMDGLETYRKIIGIHPEQKAIIASGFSETDRVKEVQSLGAGAYIKKPFLLEKIGIAVKEELEKQAVLALSSIEAYLLCGQSNHFPEKSSFFPLMALQIAHRWQQFRSPRENGPLDSSSERGDLNCGLLSGNPPKIRFCIFQIDPDGISLPSLLFVVKSHKRFTRCKISGAVPYIRGPFMKATRKTTRSPEFNGLLFQIGQSNHTVF